MPADGTSSTSAEITQIHAIWVPCFDTLSRDAVQQRPHTEGPGC